MACWVIGIVVTPSPKWTWPVGTVMFGVGFASALLYQLVNHLVGDPIEEPRWELETPTSVGNLLKQNPVGPLFVWIVFVVGTFGYLHAKNTQHLRTITAIPLALIIGTTVWSLLIFAFAKGCVRDEE
jgi:hypothetical protein